MSSLSATQTPHREYATRPADERYPSLDALVIAAETERRLSAERTYNVKDLKAVATDDSVQIAGPKGLASFTHWAFGQFARMLGAPASYLRDLPAKLAAECLNYGIAETPAGTDAVLLVKAPNGSPTPTVRAITTETYTRLWDSVLYGETAKQIFAQRSPTGAQWMNPPTWTGEPAGCYRGDRDSFVIQIDGGSIVNDPSRTDGKGQMHRGILIRNSEVGASSVTIECIFLRAICGNHLLMGAAVDSMFRRRHVGATLVRDVVREIGIIAHRWTLHSPQRDEAIIKSLIEHEIAHTKEAVIDELRKMGATKEQAETAYLSCEKLESCSPRSFWGVANGLTRLSQEDNDGWQDTRFVLDQIAAKVLARGARLVHA
jgi:hypothetical protein